MPVSFRRFPILTVNTLYHLIHFVQSGMSWLTGVVLSVQIVCVGKRGRGRVWLPLIVFFMDHYL